MADKNYSRVSKFSVINLDVKQDNLEKAIEAFKSYDIDEFKTENGKYMTAKSYVSFVETPALMTFFINRVAFEKGELVKDSRPFEFNKSILFAKEHSKDASLAQQKIAELETEKSKCLEWIDMIEAHKESLEKSIKYLESKEFNKIEHPIIENSEG